MSTRRTLVCFIGFICMLSFFLVACSTENDINSNDLKPKESSDKPQKGGDIVLGVSAEPSIFNAQYTTAAIDGTFNSIIYNSLVRFDESGTPIPDLAENWEYSDDNLTLTFYLREDVKWHDGEPFTADDVVFTFSIGNHKDYGGARGSYFEFYDEVKALDDYTVEFKFKDIDHKLLTRRNPYYILPEHLLDDIPISDLGEAEFNTKSPIGTGPFKFEEWQSGQHVKLASNEYYFDGEPYLDSVTFKIIPDQNSLLAQYQGGDLDYLSASAADAPTAYKLVEEGNAELLSEIDQRWSWIGYNNTHPILKEKKVRQALTHGLDREGIIQATMGDAATLSNIPGLPDSWAFNEEAPVFEYDVNKAKELLAEAGWSEKNSDGILTKDGEEFKIEIALSNGNKVGIQIAEIVQEQWKELGVDASVKALENSAFLDFDDPDLYLGNLSVSSDPSLTNIFHSEAIEGGLNRRTKFSDPEIDKLLKESDKMVEQKDRKEAIEDLQAIISEEQPYTMLYYPDLLILHNPKLKNVELQAGSAYRNIHEWWLEN